jgi:hypothetical protein
MQLLQVFVRSRPSAMEEMEKAILRFSSGLLITVTIFLFAEFYSQIKLIQGHI